jgi:archaellum component FlaC
VERKEKATGGLKTNKVSVFIFLFRFLNIKMLPFILLGGALIAGAIGVGAAADAADKFNKAKRIAKRAQRKYEQKIEEVQETLDTLNNKLNILGNIYLEIYQKDFPELVKFLKKIKTELIITSQPKVVKRWYQEIPQLEQKFELVDKIVEGIAKGAIKGIKTGTATVLGLTSFVYTFGTASTGTAISTLSGAALRNALLAWFGGGAISAGGLGMAGGILVLGSLAVGPALLVGGLALNGKAEEALTKAMKYEAQVEKEIAKLTLFQKNIEETIVLVEKEIDILEKSLILFRKQFNKVKFLYFPVKVNLFRRKFETNLEILLTLGKYIRDLTEISPFVDRKTLKPNRGHTASVEC